MRYALLLLAGCWTSGPPRPPPPLEEPSVFEITLERRRCTSACPVYTVSIDGDGRVHWVGHANVHALGARRATVALKRVAELQRMIDHVRFFARDENGEIPHVGCNGKECSFQDSVICSGGGDASLTVRNGHLTYTVRNDHCEPSPLDELEALIDDVARTTAWITERVSD